MDAAGPEVLGIDFGTSNTVAVLASPGRPPRPLSIDGTGWIPSAIYVDDDGTLSVGRDAERKARLSPERFEANPKRRIDDGEILLGVRVVPVVDAIAAVLRRVGEEARRQLNGRSPDQVHLTHPAQWGASRQNILLAAARAAGLGTTQITLIPEPVAAAAHFASLAGKTLPVGSSLAVYDLGGGTFDCAVVGATRQGFTVLAESGLADVGGVDFDQVVVDHLGRTVSSADPARWQALSRPRTAGDRRAARALREDVRAAKETLSRYAQTDLPLPDPFEDTLLTRREFEGLVRPVLTRTVEVLAETVRRAGLTPDRLVGVYLVGGSSRIPLIASLISDKLGVVATTLDQPETSVAMGAALAPGGTRPSNQTIVVSGGQPPVGAPPGNQGQGMPSPMSAPNSAQMPPQQAGPPRPLTGPAQPGTSGPRPPGGPVGPPPGYRQHPPAFNPAAGPPPAVSKSRRNLLIALVAAAVVAISAVVVVIVASSGGSSAGPGGTTTRSTPASSSAAPASSAAPVDCAATPKDDTGMSPCLVAFSGTAKADAIKCTDDVSTYEDIKDLIAEIKPAAFSVCVFTANGKLLVAVLIHATSTESRDAIYDQERRSIGGSTATWSQGGQTGSWAPGTLIASGEPEVVWKFDDLPIVAVLTATTQDDTKSGATAADLESYWRSHLLPTEQ